jgi:hypothetical protein
MSEYGKINGVPIDPGEGWEIVPAGTYENHDMEYFDSEENKWFSNIFTKPRRVDYFVINDILAFRRPKTVQVGQGESDPASFNMEMHMATCIHHNDQERKWNRCPVCEIKSLNAKLAAQALALDAAGMALHKAQDYLWRSVQSKDKRGQRIFDSVSKALTVIQQAKGVGK